MTLSGSNEKHLVTEATEQPWKEKQNKKAINGDINETK